MEAGAYDLTLYCDSKIDHWNHPLPYQYLGETRAECVRQARSRGWVFHKDGSHTGPCCNKKKASVAAAKG